MTRRRSAAIDPLRVTRANDRDIVARGDYVLYWMIAARRTRWSCALDRAIEHAVTLGRPLVVLEALRAGYRWASDRMHAFVLAGMADNAAAFGGAGVTYLPYVEREAGRGSGLVEALGKRACIVVTDEQPGFFLTRMVDAVAPRLACRVERVDGNGLLPLRAAERWYPTAMAFRRELQRKLPGHLVARPVADPLAAIPRALRGGEVAGTILRRWPIGCDVDLAGLPIDHEVAPAPFAGGAVAGAAVLKRFLRDRLARYADEHSHPDAEADSALSPYLHFGHVAAHEVADAVWRAAKWDPGRLAGARVTGKRTGWWSLPPSSEAFLDELVTWRELGYGFCFHRADHAAYGALPAWARATLAKHERDPRPERYTRAQLAAAATGDPVWNAAQRQLLRDGRIHNYLRMLWGKKILEWSASPRAALATLIELNNRYAVDGRDPNSYSDILWTLGLFDRPWGPERPIFGTIRYMSSASTLRKLDMTAYLARYA